MKKSQRDKPSTASKHCQILVERSLVLSDIHFASADEPLVDLIAFKFGKDFKPHNIFLNGDIIDCWAVSNFTKHPTIKNSLTDDIEACKAFLKRLRKTYPKARIVYVGGNHEYRIDRYLADNAPELFPYVNIKDILDLKELAIEWVGSIHKENWFKYRDLYIGHYDKAAGNAASTAQSLLRERGVSLIQGHVHKVGMTAKTFIDRTLFAYENPCLCLLENDYVKTPNWQQGATVIYADKTTTWVSPIVIKNRKFIWSGKEYSA